MKAKEIIKELEVLSSKDVAVNAVKINTIKKTKGLDNFLLNLVGYWGIIKLALKFVKLFTGPKADKKIDEIIAWGDENLN